MIRERLEEAPGGGSDHGGVLVNLIASAVASVAGQAWTKVRATPEERTVKTAIGEALDEALRSAALPLGRAIDHAWVARMENAWHPVFTAKEVSQQLVASLTDPCGEPGRPRRSCAAT